MTTLTAACVQVNAGPDLGPNIDAALALGREAAGRGADLVAFPENVAAMTFGREYVLARARVEAEHPAIPAFQGLARETGAWVLAGTLAIRVEEERAANRAYLLDPDGNIAATYDKIHMFDVDLGGGESYRESDTMRPGEEAVVAETPWGGVGLTVCYDVRFPHLYRDLARAGANILTIPAAFTRVTGEGHWHTLVRARAIETGCFVLAPAQCGTHHRGRETYGHSLIVDPWGTVLAEGAAEEPGVVTAELDLDRVAEIRGKVPALWGDRQYKPARRHAGAP